MPERWPLSCLASGVHVPVCAWWCWDLSPVPAPLPVAAGQRQRNVRAMPAAAAGAGTFCCCWWCVRVCCIIHARQAVPRCRLCDLGRGVEVAPVGEVCCAGWQRRSPGRQAGGGSPQVRWRYLCCCSPAPGFHVGFPPVWPAAVDAVHHACFYGTAVADSESQGVSRRLPESPRDCCQQNEDFAAPVDFSQIGSAGMDASGCAAAPKEFTWPQKLEAGLISSGLMSRSHMTPRQLQLGPHGVDSTRNVASGPLHLHRRTLIYSNPAEGAVSAHPSYPAFRPARCSSPQASRPGVAWMDPGMGPGPCPASASCLSARQQQQQGGDPARVQQGAGSPSCCDRQSPRQQQSQPQTPQHRPARPQPCRSSPRRLSSPSWMQQATSWSLWTSSPTGGWAGWDNSRVVDPVSSLRDKTLTTVHPCS